jgi:hypothetical protein
MPKFLGGMEIVINPYINHQKWVRRPKLPATKKRRIRKKWMRRYPQGAWVTEYRIYYVMGKYVMHPDTYEALKAQIERGK